MAKQKNSLATQPLEPLIYMVRDTRVMLDVDLAGLYGVTTKQFNQALKRNMDRFPEDFAFRLTREEWDKLLAVREKGMWSQNVTTSNEQETLRSQTVTSKTSDEEILISQNATSKATDEETMRSQIATSSQKYRRSNFLPWAFTEHGALMAANILRSERATEMSVFIIRAFVKLREHTAANEAILKRLTEIDSKLLTHDTKLSDLYRKIMPLLQTPVPPKRKIGFRRNDEE